MAANPLPTQTSEAQKKPHNSLSEIEALISSWSCAQQALEKLVSELKCDRHQLLFHLRFIQKPPVISDDWLAMLGMPKRRIRPILNRLMKCAADIERVNSQRLTYVWRHYGNRPQVFDQLPHLIREYALELEAGLRWGGPKKHPARDIAKYLLVDYVKSTTRKFRDKEVSRLIAAVLKNDSYDSLDHRMWRRKYCNKFSSAPRSGLAVRSEVHPPLPPKP